MYTFRIIPKNALGRRIITITRTWSDKQECLEFVHQYIEECRVNGNFLGGTIRVVDISTYYEVTVWEGVI